MILRRFAGILNLFCKCVVFWGSKLAFNHPPQAGHVVVGVLSLGRACMRKNIRLASHKGAHLTVHQSESRPMKCDVGNVNDTNII